MNFLRWIFKINVRHSGDIRRYEKGKIGTRIFVILLLLAIAGGTLGVEYWCINLFNNNDTFLSGILVLIFLLIPLAYTTMEFCGLYSYLGFKMFFWGTVSSIANKIDAKRIEKTVVADETGVMVIEEEKESKAQKAHKWIDLFVGILGIVLTVGVLVMLFVLPISIIG
ncbi:MAG: hypothetical protein ACI4R8_03365 [Candidatus Caccovivens sp.]